MGFSSENQQKCYIKVKAKESVRRILWGDHDESESEEEPKVVADDEVETDDEDEDEGRGEDLLKELFGNDEANFETDGSDSDIPAISSLKVIVEQRRHRSRSRRLSRTRVIRMPKIILGMAGGRL
jgi:hypothetical protein